MCFSAQASFLGAGTLVLIGIWPIRSTLLVLKNQSFIQKISRNRNQKIGLILMAIIPWAFALHQFLEGLVWLSITYTGLETLKIISEYSYCLLGFIGWQLHGSSIAFFLEPDASRKKILRIFFYGSFVSGLWALILIFYYGVDVSVKNEHLSYTMMPIILNYSLSFLHHIYSTFVYFFSTLIPLKIFGVVLVFSSALAYVIVQTTSYPSIWCFFAAILSIVMAFIVDSYIKDIQK